MEGKLAEIEETRSTQAAQGIIESIVEATRRSYRVEDKYQRDLEILGGVQSLDFDDGRYV
jgi:hypothetical protein